MHPKTKTKRRRRKAKKPELITMAAYAERRGVSRPAVKKAIESGRISAAAASKNDRGHWAIDADLADKEWKANSVREKAGVSAERKTSAARSVAAADQQLRFGAHAIPVNDDGEAMTRADVATVREAALAKQAQLDLAERKRNLVRLDDMKKLAAGLGRELTDGVLSVPAKLAEDLAACSDPAECEIKMEQALVKALRVMAQFVEALE